MLENLRTEIHNLNLELPQNHLVAWTGGMIHPGRSPGIYLPLS
jgi:hypothetical protein